MIFLSRADILAYFVLNYDSPDLLLCGRKWWLRLKVIYEIIVLSGWLLWRGHFPNRLAEKSISEIKIFTSEVEKIKSEVGKSGKDGNAEKHALVIFVFMGHHPRKFSRARTRTLLQICVFILHFLYRGIQASDFQCNKGEGFLRLFWLEKEGEQ